ncbi:hypothetical protein N7532_005081 [Penicillium argentinense]|uniref:Pre-rRNA-processing protein ESF2 n=1 Tax=Penicillium argentinense TaxID=1131581 RepID=A0A9W9FDH6_9EURO|nr:uncharacterized protein N7532_005081 [Penicillium argentinense]KAJ5098080.1 hypothetical protein N7532_005081 [Penicillium argentinense]
MTTRMHNEFLDLPESDEELSDHGYESEENLTRSKGRTTKRQRRTDTQDLLGLQSDQSDQEVFDDDEPEGKGKAHNKTTKPRDDEVSEDDDEAEDRDGGVYLDTTKDKKPLSTKQLKPTKKSKKKPGVIYLSSLPPYLRPSALRTFIEQRGFGPITKVFLQPTVPNSSAPKRRSNKRKTYSDGWVEFQSKATAKLAAETLNCQIIGGKKGSWYHDDIWNMKYLTGLKWDQLMEQMRIERVQREGRQRAEDMRAKREEKAFLEGVEKSRIQQGIEKTKEAQRKRRLDAGDAAEEPQPQKPQEKKPRRTFKQNDIVSAKKTESLGDDAKRVLGKIF